MTLVGHGDYADLEIVSDEPLPFVISGVERHWGGGGRAVLRFG